MKIKPKSCSCKGCKAAKAKQQGMERLLQKRFRQDMRRVCREAIEYGEQTSEADTSKLSYIWA